MRPRLTFVTLALALLALAPLPPAHAQSSDARVVAQALSRTRGLETYRLTVTVAARGTLADPAARSPTGRAATLIDFRGLFRGPDLAFTYRTHDSAARGFDPQRGLESAVVGGVTFAAGPLPVPGAAAPRWYDFGAEPPPAIQPPLTVRSALDLVARELDPVTLTRQRVETLDGQRCTLYRGDAAAVSATLLSLDRPLIELETPVADQLAAVTLDRTAYAAWLCADGVVRRVDVTASGFATRAPARRFAADIRVLLSDVNSPALSIVPPTESVRLTTVASPTARAGAAPVEARLTPDARGQAVGRMPAREEVQIIERTADGRWLRVRSIRVIGWVPAGAIAASRAVLAGVPVFDESLAAARPAPLPVPTPRTAQRTVAVQTSGDLLDAPGGAQVVDRVQGGESVQVLARDRTGAWYRVTTIRGVTGWSPAGLLLVPPEMAPRIPVEELP